MLIAINFVLSELEQRGRYYLQKRVTILTRRTHLEFVVKMSFLRAPPFDHLPDVSIRADGDVLSVPHAHKVVVENGG